MTEIWLFVRLILSKFCILHSNFHSAVSILSLGMGKHILYPFTGINPLFSFKWRTRSFNLLLQDRQKATFNWLFYLCRFVQFGPEVRCHCGTNNCQGYLGTKKKIDKALLLEQDSQSKMSQNPPLLKDVLSAEIFWGSKRKRSSTLRNCTEAAVSTTV